MWVRGSGRQQACSLATATTTTKRPTALLIEWLKLKIDDWRFTCAPLRRRLRASASQSVSAGSLCTFDLHSITGRWLMQPKHLTAFLSWWKPPSTGAQAHIADYWLCVDTGLRQVRQCGPRQDRRLVVSQPGPACLPTIYQISSSRNKPLPVRWLDDWSLAALSLSHQHRHTHTLITTLLLLLLLLWSHGFWGATPKEESSVCLGSVPLRTILLAAVCVALPSVQCCSRLGGDHLDHFLPF